jgi:hypothetical protein
VATRTGPAVGPAECHLLWRAGRALTIAFSERSIAQMTWVNASRPYWGVAWLCFACGEAPPAPSALELPAGTSAAGGTSTVVLGAQPQAGGSSTTQDDVVRPAPEVDAGASAPATPGASGAVSPPAAAGTGQTFAGCTESKLGCDSIYLTMVDASNRLCVQLALQSCGVLARAGLPVALPLRWRLASASVTPGQLECDPLAFYATSVPVSNASGSIDWNDKGLQPSKFLIDVTLEPSQATEASDSVPPSVVVKTTSLTAPLPECPE